MRIVCKKTALFQQSNKGNLNEEMILNQIKKRKIINIGIVDDDPVFTLLLNKVLADHDEVCFNLLFVLNSMNELSNIEDAYYNPDIIVCDINMPGISGIDGLPLLLKRFKNCKILMCSGIDDMDTIVRAVHSGAHGYVRKVLTREEFFNAVFHVMEGSIYISPVFIKVVFDIIQFKVFHFDNLTERELSVVDGILKGMSYKLIGYKFDISVNTVRDHIKRIYKKLKINSKGELYAMVTNSDIND